jgi:hypothetical protein
VMGTRMRWGVVVGRPFGPERRWRLWHRVELMAARWKMGANAWPDRGGRRPTGGPHAAADFQINKP